MPEEGGKPAPAPAGGAQATADPTIEDALSAADGTRKAAQWIASALAGIPGLAVVASIVSGPGDHGFDPTELALGIGLAAAGVVLGLFFFARVITPLALEDYNFTGFPMARVPDAPRLTFTELEEAIHGRQRTLGTAATRLADAKAVAARASAEATVAEGDLSVAVAQLKEAAADSPAKAELASRAAEALTHAQTARNAAQQATGTEKALAATFERSQAQLGAAEELRRDAYRLKTADTVRSRFDTARWSLPVAVALTAAGLVLVGIAPKEEPAKAASGPSLVTLDLNKRGRDRIGCVDKQLQALRVGGDEKTPVVITLPVPGCPSKTVKFTTAAPAPLGTLTAAKPIEPR